MSDPIGTSNDQLITVIDHQGQNKKLSDVNTYEDLFKFFDGDGKLQIVPTGDPFGSWQLVGSADTPEDEDYFFDMIDQISFRVLEDLGETNFYEPLENDGCDT